MNNMRSQPLKTTAKQEVRFGEVGVTGLLIKVDNSTVRTDRKQTRYNAL